MTEISMDKSLIFNQIFVKLTGKGDRHKILVKVDFGPDWITHFQSLE